MRDKLPDYLLDKYFAGACNVLEKAAVEDWYRSFESVRDDVSQLSEKEQTLFKFLMWKAIAENIEDAEADDPSNHPIKNRIKKKSTIYWLSGVAAMLLIALFIKVKTASLPIAPLLSKNHKQLQLFKNDSNNIQKITLSDGSNVWVSPHSSLSYLKSFEKKRRKVYLSGEAFFEVTKNPRRPFVIYTGKVITKVWGTSFRIKAFTSANTIKVDVVTGKVSVCLNGEMAKQETAYKAAVQPSKTSVILFPSQGAVYSKLSDKLIKEIIVKDKSMGIWKKASLSFNNVPLPEVFKVLSKKFEVSISSKDDLINKDNLKADFTNENLPTILEILKTTFNVSYQVTKDGFVLENN